MIIAFLGLMLKTGLMRDMLESVPIVYHRYRMLWQHTPLRDPVTIRSAHCQ